MVKRPTPKPVSRTTPSPKSRSTIRRKPRDLDALLYEAIAKLELARNQIPVKRIINYTREELDEAVQRAENVVPNFWVVLNGIDAYIERRRRKRLYAKARDQKKIDQIIREESENLFGLHIGQD